MRELVLEDGVVNIDDRCTNLEYEYDNLLSDTGKEAIFGDAGNYTVAQAFEKLAIPPQYGTCNTPESTPSKMGILPGFVLNTGVIIALRFTYSNNNGNLTTLNVNSTGGKLVQHNGRSIPRNSIQAGQIAYFQYNGETWNLLNPMFVYSTSYEIPGKLRRAVS